MWHARNGAYTFENTWPVLANITPQIEGICIEATGKRQANYMPLKSQFHCFILAQRVNMDSAVPHELLL